MADINEIIAKEAIEGIKNADKAISSFDDGIMKVISHYKELNSLAGKGGMKEFSDTTKRAAEAEKELAKQAKEAERAAKKLADTQAKAAAKEREHVEALKMEVKTVGDAQRQLKALTIERNKAATSMGKQSQAVKDLNARMQQNTEFIRANGTAAEKQRMNIGNYASAFKGLGTAMLGALGITAGLSGAIKGFKFVMNSTEGTADAFQRTLSGIREQASYLGRAFATMDFSNFIKNMAEARKEGERFYNQLDLIEDLQRAQKLQVNDIERQIIEQKIIAKNRSNDLKDREAAVKKIIELEELKLTQTQRLAQKGIDNQLQNAAFQTKYSEQQILDFVKNYDKYVEEISAGQKLIDDINRKTRTETVTPYGTQVNVNTKERERLYNSLTKAQEKQLMYAVLEKKLTTEQRTAIVELADVSDKANLDMLRGKEELVGIENRLRRELLRNEAAEEKEAAASVKASTEKKTAMQLLTDKISALRGEIEESLILTGQAPQGLIRQLLGSQAELQSVKDQMAQIEAGYSKLVSKGVTSLNGSSGGATLTPKASPGAFGASDPAKGFTADEYKELALGATQEMSDAAFQIIANADQAAFDAKMSNLEKEKEAKLKNANLTEKQKAKIEEEYQKKAAKLKEAQFRKQKAADIIQSIINTALAVTKNLANPPLAIAAAIAGAAQTAVIAAQPVPQFDKGSVYTPHTFIAGEHRPEWMITPSGDVQLVTRPTMFKNMAGATVIGGSETERMMKSGIVPKQDIRPDIERMRADIVKAISNKKELYITATGTRITEREGEYFKTYFNRKIQWAGRKN